MLKQTLLLLLACFVFATNAAIDLSGTVFDKDNKPLPGVQVMLSRSGYSEVTGSDGRWHITEASTRLGDLPQRASAKWDGKSLRLNLVAPALVQLDAYDVRGVRLGRLAQVQLEPGSHSIPVSRASAATGMSWMRLQVGDQQQILGVHGYVRLKQELPPTLARSMTDSVEQLVYSLQGQLVTADTVTNLIQSGLEKWIQEFNISGKVIPDGRVYVDTVFAWFDGGRMSGLRRGRLGFNRINSAYSGRIYSVKSLNDGVYKYRVWLNVMGNKNKRTGISDTTDFTSDFGNIDFIPEFSTGNAIPNGAITGPIKGLVNSDHEFGIFLNRKDEVIARYEWDNGLGKGFADGGPIYTTKWMQPGKYYVRTRLTDIDSNQSTFVNLITITNQEAVLSGVKNAKITISDVMNFTLNVSDKDGVSKVLWDFGDGVTDSTFTGEQHSVSHTYPGADRVPMGTTTDFPLSLHVYDTLGAITFRQYEINVVNDTPTVIVSDTIGEPDSVVKLYANSNDQGVIAKIEWSINNAPFTVGRADTTIRLPSTPTVKYPVVVRVTDDDGNISRLDTTMIFVGKIFTDTRNGKRYPVVTIGSQTWMARNLDYKVDSSFSYSEVGQPKYTKFGRLYNWSAALALPDSCSRGKCLDRITSQHRGVCPEGWHVPSNAEWVTLSGFKSDMANRLRSTSDWYPGSTYNGSTFVTTNRNGTDDFGFNAFPGGYRANYTYVSDIGTVGYFLNTSNYTRVADNLISNDSIYGYNPLSFSLRCIEDTLGVFIKDTIVETGAQIRIFADARGKAGAPIATYEWSVDGGAFTTGTANLVVSAPSIPTPNYKILARVTDANGNVSRIDTAKITVLEYFTDARDGQRYPYTKIGKQVWMAQNLNFKTDSSFSYSELGQAKGARYGRLYNWSAAMAISDTCKTGKCFDQIGPQHRGVCPEGWHIPSYSEWNILNNLKSNMQSRLKSTSDWNPGYEYSGTTATLMDKNGTNEYGFGALPGGSRSANVYNGMNSTLYDFGNIGNWWSLGNYMANTLNQSNVNQIRGAVTYGYTAISANIRCIQDTLSVSVLNRDTAVTIGSTIRIRTDARGKAGAAITKYEWNVNGAGFTTGNATLEVAAPNTQNANYTVLVRVTDANGTVSAVDSTKVWVGHLFTDDRDGQVYKKTTIGTQTWMAQNLNYKMDSASISTDTNYNAKRAGRYYSWPVALGLDDSCHTGVCSTLVVGKVKGICPTGWHVPSRAEWEALITAVGGSGNAGTKLKSSSGWPSSYYMGSTSGNGTDDYGFSAIPAGVWNNYSNSTGSSAQWWAASGNNSTSAWNISMNSSGYSYASQFSYYSATKSTVRCIEDK